MIVIATGFIPLSLLSVVSTDVNPFRNNKFYTLPNWKSLQMTISNLTKMAASYPSLCGNGLSGKAASGLERILWGVLVKRTAWNTIQSINVQTGGKHCGKKREIAHYEKYHHFQDYFQNTCTADRACLGLIWLKMCNFSFTSGYQDFLLFPKCL